MQIESMLHGGPPPWPTDNNWSDIVNTHNEMVDAGKYTAVELSSASKSITLAMVCAVMRIAIPTKYKLKTRPMGIGDHTDYVSNYAESECKGVSPTPGIGGRIAKQIIPFAQEMGLPIKAICEGLAIALRTGQISKRTMQESESALIESKQEPEMTEQATVPSNIILYGPPGTGKTYSTKQKAVELCDGFAPNNRAEVLSRYEQLREINRIEFVTFHQSFSYEDFIEGLRPVLTDGDDAPTSISYECHPGIFRRICSAAEMATKAVDSSNAGLDVTNRRLFKMSLGDTSRASDDYLFNESIENGYILLGWGEGLDFTGLSSVADITEKLRTVMPDIKSTDYNVTSVNYILNEIKPGDLVLVSYGNLRFRAIGEVTGDYEWMDRNGTDTYCQKRSVRWLRVFEESQPIDLIFKKRLSQMTLYLMDQSSIKREALQALLTPPTTGTPENYVLVIDEINRANISKVFGELITLVEPDKRLNGEEPLLVRLPYSDKPFGVPSNLHIIGTMNTADRSIALVDIALRRRFEFKEMMPEYDLLPENTEGINIQTLLKTINQRIEYLYDRDHVIGHAYLMRVTSLNDLRLAFINKIIPLLQEYFYGDWKKICLVLGCPVDDSGKQGNVDSAIIKADNTGLGYAWQEYEDKPTFRIHNDFESPQYADLIKFFETAIKGPGKSE